MIRRERLSIFGSEERQRLFAAVHCIVWPSLSLSTGQLAAVVGAHSGVSGGKMNLTLIVSEAKIPPIDEAMKTLMKMEKTFNDRK